VANLERIAQEHETLDPFQRLDERCLLRGQAQHIDAARRAQVQV
jgi:hypothetical protein